jgi:predicted CopG family antitoxin
MVKVISLSNEAYEKLSRIKRNSSFSEVVVNLIEKSNKGKLREFAGILNGKEGKEFKEFIKKNREKQKLRGVEF